MRDHSLFHLRCAEEPGECQPTEPKVFPEAPLPMNQLPRDTLEEKRYLLLRAGVHRIFEQSIQEVELAQEARTVGIEESEARRLLGLDRLGVQTFFAEAVHGGDVEGF